MARETGDLWPQTSGSASFGAEMNNGGFTGAIRPFAHMHMNSGVFHDSFGNSGVMRFQRAVNIFDAYGQAFALSFDGGKNYTYEVSINGTYDPFDIAMAVPYGDLTIFASGDFGMLGRDIGIIADTGNTSVSATLGSVIIDAGTNVSIDAAATLSVNANIVSENIAGTRSSSSDNVSFTVVNGFNVLSSNGSIQFETQDVSANVELNSVGDVVLEAFNHSGILSYKFGPYQSWYIKTTHSNTGGPYNDGSWPIAHSGNLSQMINQAVLGIGSGLQNAYNGGRRIIMNSTVGDLEMISDTAKLKLAGTTRAELNMSGVYTRPSASQEMGDMWMMAHSALESIGANVQAADITEARNRSLGLATLAYDTGSGIINISNGSGIMQCLNSSTMKLTTVTQTLPLVAASPCSDNNYHIGTGANSGQITILTPGLYKADFKVFSFKDTGTTPQTVQTNATLNGTNILGSFINSFHYDNTTAANGSASVSVLFNANAGDIFRLISSSTLAGADNCTLALRGALLVLQKIGPKRGTF